MPAKKAARQSVKRYTRNHGVRSATRTAVGNARRAVDSQDVATAEPAVRHAISMLDKAVKKGVLHKNNASRGKARLSAALNKMQ